MTFRVPPVGGVNCMPGSTPGGGQMTPFEVGKLVAQGFCFVGPSNRRAVASYIRRTIGLCQRAVVVRGLCERKACPAGEQSRVIPETLNPNSPLRLFKCSIVEKGSSSGPWAQFKLGQQVFATRRTAQGFSLGRLRLRSSLLAMARSPTTSVAVSLHSATVEP